MSKLDNLSNLLREQVFNNITEYWEESQTYAVVDLSVNDLSINYIVEPLKNGRRIISNYARGIYMWQHKDKILYIGKTDAPTMSIHLRQKNHFRSFEKPLEQHESSGRKYREFLEENGLQNMKVVIKYIDTSKSNISGIAELLETASIDYYQPMLNREIKGRGKRNEV